MKIRQMTDPRLMDVLGHQAGDFPEGFLLPVNAIIREGYRAEKEAINAGESVEFRFPSYGVLTFRGRNYTFVPNKGYARIKGYADEISGRWG